MGSLCGVRGQDENHMIRSRQKSQAKQQTQVYYELISHQ